MLKSGGGGGRHGREFEQTLGDGRENRGTGCAAECGVAEPDVTQWVKNSNRCLNEGEEAGLLPTHLTRLK